MVEGCSSASRRRCWPSSVQAVIRIGRRALRNGAMLAIAAASFVAIFAPIARAFPLIVLAAGLIGYAGSRTGLPAFAKGGGRNASAQCRLMMPTRFWANARPRLVNRAWALASRQCF